MVLCALQSDLCIIAAVWSHRRPLVVCGPCALAVQEKGVVMH